MEKDNISKLFIPASILMGALIIAGALTWNPDTSSKPSSSSGSTANTQPAMTGIDMSKINTVGEPSVGPVDAPVTMFYWYDYQCPYCQRFEKTTISQLVTEYANSGKIRIVFKDLQFLGPESQTLGVLGRAVWDTAPTKFYAWHKAVLAKQETLGRGWATAEALLAVTTEVLGSADANRAIARAETNAEAYIADLEASKQDGSSIGVRSTPTSLIDGNLIIGARSYVDIKAVIDEALANL